MGVHYVWTNLFQTEFARIASGEHGKIILSIPHHGTTTKKIAEHCA